MKFENLAMNNKVSTETQDQAMKVAKGTQKKGQTKEQTKLIAQGIEKGIAEYKKQQSKKARERDKERKQKLKQQQKCAAMKEEKKVVIQPKASKLPWILLVLTWLIFAAYFLFQ